MSPDHEGARVSDRNILGAPGEYGSQRRASGDGRHRDENYRLVRVRLNNGHAPSAYVLKPPANAGTLPALRSETT